MHRLVRRRRRRRSRMASAAAPGRIDEATLRDLIEPVGDLDELDQACFHKGDDRWRQVSGDESWDHVFERTLVYLRTQLGYFFDFNIAEGSFGRLVRMYDPENRADVTVWVDICTPYLQTCVAYVMPAFRCTLHQKVSLKAFLCSEGSYAAVKFWLSQVADALEYLHQRELFHLDVSLRNVFILQADRAVLGGLASLQPSRMVSAGDVRLDSVFAPPDVIAARIGLAAPVPATGGGDLQADRVDAWGFCTLVAEALTCHWRWKVRKFLVLSKSRDRSTADRLSLLADYVTSRFTSTACLRRYVHQHFRGAHVDDDEVSALAALLALGLRVDATARRPVAAMRAHKYWHAPQARSPTSPVENVVESSLDNTTTCTWDASSAELPYRQASGEEEEDDTDDDDEEEEGGGEPQHSDTGSSAAMVLLPHGPSPLQMVGGQSPGSLAARTRRWLAVLTGRQPP
ncbi:hypothetical protein HPB49_009494 [Dermacentor silvarum]|uniref:Uncharacterized protein n=1 Tax=Dermacentor silvarum TaxID=543639 RepID=A0ACB8CKE4_DERSI|nr:hypothetical protein HPB49_009494 [Dermacentor silvarum]